MRVVLDLGVGLLRLRGQLDELELPEVQLAQSLLLSLLHRDHLVLLLLLDVADDLHVPVLQLLRVVTLYPDQTNTPHYFQSASSSTSYGSSPESRGWCTSSASGSSSASPAYRVCSTDFSHPASHSRGFQPTPAGCRSSARPLPSPHLASSSEGTATSTSPGRTSFLAWSSWICSSSFPFSSSGSREPAVYSSRSRMASFCRWNSVSSSSKRKLMIVNCLLSSAGLRHEIRP